jgi:hypothetical protein
MNRREPLALTAGMLTLVLLSGTASAQLPPPGANPITRPPISPYLNLLRPGSNIAQNYYGLVRPEFAFRGGIGGLQQQVDLNSQLLTTGAAAGGTGVGGVPTTGHVAVFLTTGGYFLNRTGARGGVGGGTGGGTGVGGQAGGVGGRIGGGMGGAGGMGGGAGGLRGVR